MAEELDFGILGPLRVSSGDGEIRINALKERSLLGTLLLHRGEVVPVDRLVGELWDYELPDDPIASLRVVVARVRGRLRDAGRGTDIRRIASGYAIQVDEAHVDAERFRSRVEQGRAAMAAGSFREASEAYRAGLAEWRGTVLADVGIGIHSLPIVECLEEERLAALGDRIEADLARGCHSEVISELAELVVRHPLNETFTRQLMTALSRTGRHADALRTAAAFRSGLSELGSKPGRALIELETDILAHRPATLPGAGVLPTGTVSTPLAGTDPAVLSRPLTVAAVAENERQPPYPACLVGVTPAKFVGREREISELERLRTKVGEGRTVLAVVLGEPGSGKTTVVGAVAERAYDDGWTVLYGRCEPHRLRPFHCISEAIHPLVSRLDALRRERLAPFDVSGRPPSDSHANRAGDRAEAIEALRDLVHTVASRRPVLLIVEDAHWIDPSSDAVLRTLLAGWRDDPILVLSTSQYDPRGTTDSNLSTSAQRDGSAEVVPLRQLDERTVVEVVEAVAGDRARADLMDARQIWHRSRGNLALATEWATDLRTSGRLPSVGPGQLDPVTLLLDHRLSGLSAGTAEVIDAAAVLGLAFSASVLAQVAGDPQLTSRALSEASRARLVEAAGTADEFRFRLTVLRKGLLAAIPSARRIFLHDKIVQTLAGPGEHPRDLELLAFHSLGAQSLQPKRAVFHAAQAAECARRRLGFESAAWWYGRCADLIAAGTRPGPHLEAQISSGLAECLSHTGAGPLVETSPCNLRAIGR